MTDTETLIILTKQLQDMNNQIIRIVGYLNRFNTRLEKVENQKYPTGKAIL